MTDEAPCDIRLLRDQDIPAVCDLMERTDAVVHGVASRSFNRVVCADALEAQSRVIVMVALIRGEVVGFVLAIRDIASYWRDFWVRHPLTAWRVVVRKLLTRVGAPRRRHARDADRLWNESSPSIAKILHIGVTARCRGQGIGTRLYRSLFRVLRERGIRRVDANIHHDNRSSLRLHEALGWELVRTAPTYFATVALRPVPRPGASGWRPRNPEELRGTGGRMGCRGLVRGAPPGGRAMRRGSWRQRLKPLAARFGVTTSNVLWEGVALRRYRRKLATNPGFRAWCETEAPRWVRDHWGHGEAVNGDFAQTHVTSQLYEVTEMLRHRLGPMGEARVLDAGASDGLFLARLNVARGVGINFLEPCARKIRSDGYPACVGDVEALPFPDKAFDYVICCETLEHVCNPIRVLNELARVCARRIFVTVPWLPRTRITGRPEGWPEVESHIFEFSEVDFAKVLTHASVRLVHRARVQVFPEPRNPMAQWWLRWWMYPSYFPVLQYYELEPRS